MKDGKRELAVVMFSDLVGYSALTQQNEELALGLLELHQKIMSVVIKEHNGRVVKTIGDAFLVKFTSAIMAVNCALQMQQVQEETNAGQSFERQIKMRIGIHLGEIINHKGDIYGDGVNIASRIEGQAEAGGICITKVVHEQVYKSFKKRLVSVGEKQLKNIDKPIELFNIEPGVLSNTKIIDISKLQNSSGPDKIRNKKMAIFLPLFLLTVVVTPIVTYFFVKQANERISSSKDNLTKANSGDVSLSEHEKKEMDLFLKKTTTIPMPPRAREFYLNSLNQDMVTLQNEDNLKERRIVLSLVKKKMVILERVSMKTHQWMLTNNSEPPKEVVILMMKFGERFKENNIQECLELEELVMNKLANKNV